MIDQLEQKVREVYTDRAFKFFEKIKAMNLTDEELKSVPSLFIPAWGVDYDSSFLRVAIAGKETLCWGNEYGDSLSCDLKAYGEGKYDVIAGCRRFREEGPAEWYNVFWQYPASALARLFGYSRDEVLKKDNPLLRSISWFNGHAIETIDSKGVSSGISSEKMQFIQRAADEFGLSDFEVFGKTFTPDVIFYFYRNGSGVPTRNFSNDIEFVQHWGDGVIDECRMNGKTILLHCPHTSFLTRGNLKQEELADLVSEIFEARKIRIALCEKSEACDFYNMTAQAWHRWVEFVRSEALKYPTEDNKSLSYRLIASVAKELAKREAKMNAQTVVLLLNEIDKFRCDKWQYSSERRGPCSTVRGAYYAYENMGKAIEAKWIADAFTRLNGQRAWE